MNVYLQNVDEKGMYGIIKKLRNNAIHRQIRERNVFDKKIKNVELQIKHKLNYFDWYILVKLLKRKCQKQRKCSSQNTPEEN